MLKRPRRRGRKGSSEEVMLSDYWIGKQVSQGDIREQGQAFSFVPEIQDIFGTKSKGKTSPFP